MFHDKLKFSSFFVKQIRLFFAFFFDQMLNRQKRIIAYFKSTISSKISLISNKKHAEFKNHDQSTQNRDLTFLISLISVDHFIHRICRRCKQHFNSKNFLHKHLTHCNKNIFSCSKYSSSKLRMKKKK